MYILIIIWNKSYNSENLFPTKSINQNCGRTYDDDGDNANDDDEDDDDDNDDDSDGGRRLLVLLLERYKHSSRK